MFKADVQPALLIIDVFSLWVTKDVLNILKDINILLARVLPNSQSILTFDLKNEKFKIVVLK